MSEYALEIIPFKQDCLTTEQVKGLALQGYDYLSLGMDVKINFLTKEFKKFGFLKLKEPVGVLIESDNKWQFDAAVRRMKDITFRDKDLIILEPAR